MCNTTLLKTSSMQRYCATTQTEPCLPPRRSLIGIKDAMAHNIYILPGRAPPLLPVTHAAQDASGFLPQSLATAFTRNKLNTMPPPFFFCKKTAELLFNSIMLEKVQKQNSQFSVNFPFVRVLNYSLVFGPKVVSKEQERYCFFSKLFVCVCCLCSKTGRKFS